MFSRLPCFLSRFVGLGLALGLFTATTAAATDPQEYNVFAVPSPEIVELVSDFSKEMEKFDLQTLYTRGFVPHATLYLTSFTEDKLGAVKKRIAEVAAAKKSFPLEIQGTHLTKGRWYFLDIVPNVKLQSLSDEFVFILSDLRNPHYKAPSWTKCCPAKQVTFEKYGSPNVFDQYNPHLTQLASEKSPKLDAFIESIKSSPPAVSGRIIGIGFAPVNPLGQAKAGSEEIFYFSDAKKTQ